MTRNIQTINRLIDNEVFMSINQLFSEVIITNDGVNTGLYDEYEENCQNMCDTDAVIEVIEQELDEEYIEEYLKDNGYKDLSEAAKLDTQGFLDFADDHNVYGCEYEHEIFERYAISQWLHSKLASIGYPVSEFKGMYLMLRTTTGQSLAADYFWTQILEALQVA